jgi:ubiquinone/menaquinone biosynthesis C-methylase UbiE
MTGKDATRISFDRLAGIFDEHRALPADAVAALHDACATMVEDGLRTLIEPGAGTGRIAIPALAAGFRVTVIDISAPMLETLAARLGKVPELRARCEIVTGDATALPFADDAFDAAVLAQVLYLIPAWEHALDEAIRVVRPGGRVLLVQERTSMSPELAAWDAAWRDAVGKAGHRAIPQVPDDDEAASALGTRTVDLRIAPLASWEFGQTVGEAIAGLDRLRPLYPDLDDAAWNEALAAFRRWHAASGLPDGARLDGTVTLTLVSGTVLGRS